MTEAETHDDALVITPARLAELEQEANASTNIPGPVTQRELRELLRVYHANVSRCDSPSETRSGSSTSTRPHTGI